MGWALAIGSTAHLGHNSTPNGGGMTQQGTRRPVVTGGGVYRLGGIRDGENGAIVPRTVCQADSV
jgi:hypothetical protein